MMLSECIRKLTSHPGPPLAARALAPRLVGFLVFAGALSLSAAVLRPPTLFAASPCLAPSCHGPMASNKNFHPPDMDCTQCHQENPGKNHPGGPAGAAFSFPSLLPCTQCHEAITDRKFSHPPVAAGECRVCHQTHGAKRYLLTVEDEAKSCSLCHKDLLPEGASVFHGPLREGKCSPCHDPHGASHRNLLPEKFATDQFLTYSDADYAFCFSCHKKRFLEFPTTSYATDFRDGEWNLHSLHVNRKTRGKNCRLCHEIHASRQPKLMADTALLGNWKMPLNFTKTGTGGGCRPGCHAEEKYDRAAPQHQRQKDSSQESGATPVRN